ncbi:MAG: DMT family transporter [Allosphingosinicella sp.]
MATRTLPAGTVLPILSATLAIAFFSAMDAVMKGLTLAIGTYNAIFWRMLLGLALSAIVYLGSRRSWPSRATLKIHVTRGAVSTVMAVAFFWGLARVPMAEAIALTFVAPLIALYLAALLLGETVGRRAVIASLVGFAGVVVIIGWRASAGGERDLWGAASLLLSAALYAYNIILMRQQALVAGPVEVAFFQNLIVASLLLPAAPFLAVAPGPEHWPTITFAALLAFVSLLLFAWAYARAEAQKLAPLEYSALVWAALFGFIVFGEQVTWSTLVGAALIITGCLLAARGGKPAGAPQAEAAL